MDEDTVKKILKNYLEKTKRKPIKIKKKQASGPDFIVESWAYECKGSKFQERKLFSQLLSYASQFSVVNLIMPCDALKNFRFIWKLEAIENFIREHPGAERSIGIYLVAEIENGKYAICNYHFARMLINEISTILYNLIPNFIQISSIEEKETKILDFLEDAEGRIKDEFRKLTIQKASESKNIWEGAIIQI